MNRSGRRMRLLPAAALAAMLGACDEDTRRIDAPPPAPLAELEGVADLPYAEPAQVSYYEPERGYQWAERAYGVQRAFYDTPPDYGFYYDDVQPYVWETADDWALYAEPWRGDYRYYYFEPGAAYPYFVRDRDYGYAYSAAGLLIAMFYPDGRYVPADVVYRVAPVAGRYYARGHDLRRIGLRAERVRIDDRVWAAEAPRVVRSADPWLRAARDDRRWREWRERDGDKELRRFERETRKRQEVAAAWRDRTAERQAVAIDRRVDRMDAQAVRAGQQDQRRDARRAQAEQRRDVQDGAGRAETRADLQRRAQAAPMRDREERHEANAQRRLAQEQRQMQRAEEDARRQADARERQQVEAERQRAKPQRQAAQDARRQAQQPSRERPQPQTRAPSAAERGQPAAAREDGGKGRGQDKPRQDGAGKDRERGRDR